MGSGKRPHRVILDVPLPLPVSLSSSFLLPTSDSHHIRDVLRATQGEPLDVCDQRTGTTYRCTVIATTPEVEVRVDEECLAVASDRCGIHVIFALCKGDKNDQVADWATELGVASITFFQSERSIVRLRDEKERATRKERFLKIARAAAQQSKRSTVPEIVLVKSLADSLSFVPSEGIKLTCSLAPDAIPLQTAISGSPSRSSVHLVVGPEGDFSPTEESLLENSGFIRASLGGTVLRAELAVVAAILLTLFSTDT